MRIVKFVVFKTEWCRLKYCGMSEVHVAACKVLKHNNNNSDLNAKQISYINL